MNYHPWALAEQLHNAFCEARSELTGFSTTPWEEIGETRRQMWAVMAVRLTMSEDRSTEMAQLLYSLYAHATQSMTGSALPKWNNIHPNKQRVWRSTAVRLAEHAASAIGFWRKLAKSDNGEVT